MATPITTPIHMAERGDHVVELAHAADVAGFRRAARRLLAHGIAPADVRWRVARAAETDLFAGSASDAARGTIAPGGDHAADVSAAQSGAEAGAVSVPAFFVALCERAALHTDPNRFGLLYRLLWRLRTEPGLRNDALDADRLQAELLARAVARDMHKMTAFVRFRPLRPAAPAGTASSGALPGAATQAALDGAAPASPPAAGALASTAAADAAWHVAWFEPAFHVVEATAPFFARRFAQMRWAILTPQRSVRWDGRALTFGPGARRDQAPPADAGERLWLTYYENIFNPARLKLAMMAKEMPRRYWPNLPEAVLIEPLTRRAHERTGRMVEQAESVPAHRRPAASIALRLDQRPRVAAPPGTIAALHEANARCLDCPIGAAATQVVHGEGPIGARLMLVGEQPGDQEDLRGRPFVGPAGQLLDRALHELGWSRQALYLTNAVKHFKFELRGRRRIHKTAAQREAAACEQWLEREIELVRPQALLALGATAARALLGVSVGVAASRGRWLTRTDGLPVLVTLHPSALLRMQPDERDAAWGGWIGDLALASAAAPADVFGAAGASVREAGAASPPPAAPSTTH